MISCWHLEFQGGFNIFKKICGPVGEAIIVAQEMLVNHSQFSGLENILSYDMHSDGHVCRHSNMLQPHIL